MFEKRYPVEAGQRVTLVELGSDAVVEGGEGSELVIRLRDGGEQDLQVEFTEAGPAVSVHGACEVELPAGCPLAIRQAQGNLKVKEVASLAAEQVRGDLRLAEVAEAALAEVYGNLKAAEVATLRVMGTVYGDAALDEVETADVQNVRGNLVAKECARLRASRVGGDLMAKRISGQVQVDQVGGNAVLKDVDGRLALEQVAGDLVAKRLEGGATVGRIGGNLSYRGGLAAGQTYQFKAGGDARVRLAEGTGAHLTLKAGGELITRVRLAGEQRTGQILTGTLGEGGAELAVEAGGNLVLGRPHADDEGEQFEEAFEKAVDFDGIGRQIGAEMNAALSRLQVKMDSMDWERIGRQAQDKIQRAMERVQHDAERVAEQASRRQEWAERMAEREAEREARRQARWERRAQAAERRVRFADDRPEAEPAAAGPAPDLDQERLIVLKMVEQGQITPQDAEMLLDAME